MGVAGPGEVQLRAMGIMGLCPVSYACIEPRRPALVLREGLRQAILSVSTKLAKVEVVMERGILECTSGQVVQVGCRPRREKTELAPVLHAGAPCIYTAMDKMNYCEFEIYYK